MNRDDIILFGEQADEVADRKIKMRGEYHPDWHQVRDEAFAALVAAHEREACAKDCETLLPSQRIYDRRFYDAVGECVAAIRGRGEEPKRHPGYIIGDHWLQAAYTRVCTGEDIRQVMEDYGYYP